MALQLTSTSIGDMSVDMFLVNRKGTSSACSSSPAWVYLTKNYVVVHGECEDWRGYIDCRWNVKRIIISKSRNGYPIDGKITIVVVKDKNNAFCLGRRQQ